MSMENAILAHAAALTELAAAVRALVDSSMGAVVAGGQRIKGNTAAEAADKTETPEKSIKGTKTDTADAKAATEEKQHKAETKTETADTPPADDAGGDEPTLDYAKDVKPKLLAAIKKAGKEKVSALIQTYGVAKAEQIDPAHFADLLAKAEAL